LNQFNPFYLRTRSVITRIIGYSVYNIFRIFDRIFVKFNCKKSSRKFYKKTENNLKNAVRRKDGKKKKSKRRREILHSITDGFLNYIIYIYIYIYNIYMFVYVKDIQFQ